MVHEGRGRRRGGGRWKIKVARRCLRFGRNWIGPLGLRRVKQIERCKIPCGIITHRQQVNRKGWGSKEDPGRTKLRINIVPSCAPPISQRQSRGGSQNVYEDLREGVSTAAHTVAEGKTDVLFIPRGFVKLIQSSSSRSHEREVRGMNWLRMAGQRILRTFF